MILKVVVVLGVGVERLFK